MRANRAQDTGPELELRQALRAAGVLGYRLNWKGAPGRPDICFPRMRVAVFVHGCFWHHCPRCRFPLPKRNRNFWKEKFSRNRRRDARKVRALLKAGWQVQTFWECDVNRSVSDCVGVVTDLLRRRKRGLA